MNLTLTKPTGLCVPRSGPPDSTVAGRLPGAGLGVQSLRQAFGNALRSTTGGELAWDYRILDSRLAPARAPTSAAGHVIHPHRPHRAGRRLEQQWRPNEGYAFGTGVIRGSLVGEAGGRRHGELPPAAGRRSTALVEERARRSAGSSGPKRLESLRGDSFADSKSKRNVQ